MPETLEGFKLVENGVVEKDWRHPNAGRTIERIDWRKVPRKGTLARAFEIQECPVGQYTIEEPRYPSAYLRVWRSQCGVQFETHLALKNMTVEEVHAAHRDYHEKGGMPESYLYPSLVMEYDLDSEGVYR